MTDMTEDQILARAREIEAARLSRARKANDERKRLERERVNLKFRQEVEAVLGQELSEDQLARVLDAVAEYKDDLEYL